jgi:hypothetical protein
MGQTAPMPAGLAAAQKIRYDDDAEFEPHTALLLLLHGVGVRIGES